MTTQSTNTPTTPLVKTPGFPHQGWEYVGCDDRGTPDNYCQYCGKNHVRYVHILSHPDWPDKIETGCVCAGKLGLAEEALAAESDEKKRAARLDRFLNVGWERNRNGDVYRTYRNVLVTLCATGRFTKIAINRNVGTMHFNDDTDAAIHAFNYIEKLKLKKAGNN